MLPPLINMKIGATQQEQELSTEECIKCLLRNGQPFILETIISYLKPGVSYSEVKKFKEKHRGHLTVSVATVPVNGEDALQVGIFMQKDLINDVVAIIGPKIAGLDENYVPETWPNEFLNWLATKLVTFATYTASSLFNGLINVLFEDGKFDITLQVTDMWIKDSLKAEVLAKEAQYTWAFVKAANLIYKAYQATKSGQKTELSLQQINDWLTAKMKAKIHGKTSSQ
tara:strand:+ start:1085 stop:1765 length:681 start_codon:yes stop_codon:yes gene_type:complete